MTAPFAIREASEHGVASIYLSGEIDLAARPSLRAAISDQLHHEAVVRVIVDLSDVTFLDSSGIGALIGCRRMADESGKPMHVLGAQGRVKAVLDLTGVSSLLAGEPPPAASN